MIDRKNFDDSIELLLKRVSGEFKHSFSNPCFQDIDFTLRRLLEIISIEDDSLIQLYIKDDIKNTETLLKEMENYRNRLMSIEDHQSYRSKIYKILSSIKQNSKTFYDDRLTEEE